MYSFKKENEDTYKLITDTKEFTFTRTIDLAKELQKVDMYTTLYMADILEERGETFENTKLKVERKEGNKVIVDETNFNKLKEQARVLAYYDILNKIFKKLFNEDYIGLIQAIGINIENEEEINKFVTELTNILIKGIQEDTPRE